MKTWIDGYGMGLHPIHTKIIDNGLGHTGGHLVTRSFAVHFPNENITLAYLTNGEKYQMEYLIDDILRILQNQPTGISTPRPLTLLITWLVISIVLFSTQKIHRQWTLSFCLQLLGIFIPVIYWQGLWGSALLQKDHDWVSDLTFNLETYYSASGNWMAVSAFLAGALGLVWWRLSLRILLKSPISLLPLLPLIILPLGWIGRSLFPDPHPYFSLFANIPFTVGLSPVLALLFWRKLRTSGWAILSFTLLLLPLLVLIGRPFFGPYVHDKMGLIQRLFILGWTLWILVISRRIATFSQIPGNLTKE